jgi:DNA-binding transcriptional regulator YhcF (GntR family)
LELEFAIDPTSPVPAQTQIVDQVRLWLLMGRLKPGDTLPSLRALERKLGLGRSIVWAAYRELQQSGTIQLNQGSRAQIADQQNGQSRLLTKRARECEALSKQILDEIRKHGFLPSSFVRYLDSRAREEEAEHHRLVVVDDSQCLADDFARQVSGAWGAYARPMKISDLIAQPQEVTKVRCVIATYWFTGLAAWAKPHKVPVYMVSTSWSEQTLESIRSLPAGSKTLLVFYEEDYIHNGPLFADDLHKAIGDPRKLIVSGSIRTTKDLEPLIASREFRRLLIGNRVWDNLGADIRQLPQVGRPMVELNKAELDRLRLQAGVVF